MSFVKKIKGSLFDASGAVAVIVAILIIAIIGMSALVVDMGSLYEDRRTLQGVADAAALAGVQELPESTDDATMEVYNNIEENYQDENNNISADIQFGSFMGVADTMITVTVTNPDSPIRFGRIYGNSSANVSATATAVIGSPAGYNIVPWGLTEGDYEYGDEYTLKFGAPPENSPGNFGALGIDGQGAKIYEKSIINGCETSVEIGQWINVQTGNIKGKTESGVEGRIALLPDGDLTEPLSSLVNEYFDLIKADSQFIIIPIISEWPIGHSEEVQILDLKPFLLSNYYEDGGHSYVEGTFLREVLIVNYGDIGGLDDTGIRIIRLIK